MVKSEIADCVMEKRREGGVSVQTGTTTAFLEMAKQ